MFDGDDCESRTTADDGSTNLPNVVLPDTAMLADDNTVDEDDLRNVRDVLFVDAVLIVKFVAASTNVFALPTATDSAPTAANNSELI